MIDVATDIGTILQNEGVGNIGSLIFIGADQLDEPDEVVTVRLEGSYQPNSPALDYIYPTVRVDVRASKGERDRSMQLMDEVGVSLHGQVSYVVGNSRYVQIFQSLGPTELPQDAQMRPMFFMTFDMIRTTYTGGSK